MEATPKPNTIKTHDGIEVAPGEQAYDFYADVLDDTAVVTLEAILPTSTSPSSLNLIVALTSPLHWRGGILHALFKNKGSSLDRKCYRDIMLGGISGKCVSKSIRSCIPPLLS